MRKENYIELQLLYNVHCSKICGVILLLLLSLLLLL